jgi:hypothetical protein
MKTKLVLNRLALAFVVATIAFGASVASAGPVRVSAQANVQVWVDGGDVFDNYADVAIWVRPERDCYTTLFMVDTDGYVHVLYPSSSFEDAWLNGGRSYCYRGRDLGLERFDGVGMAYVFAVGSPVPFDYSVYGASVFVGGFGFRVYGDPFVACRDFYAAMLPVTCRWDYVGVSYARFYVRRWERYPSYLCHRGPVVHVRIGDACRSCGDIYVSYRDNCARPWEALRPAPKFKRAYYDESSRTARAGRVERARHEEFKAQPRDRTPHSDKPAYAKHASKPTYREGVARVDRDRSVDHDRAVAEKRTKSPDRARVVSTSSSRDRSSADKARASKPSASATKKYASNASRSDEKHPSATASRSDREREKGSKKKQAR